LSAYCRAAVSFLVLLASASLVAAPALSQSSDGARVLTTTIQPGTTRSYTLPVTIRGRDVKKVAFKLAENSDLVAHLWRAPDGMQIAVRRNGEVIGDGERLWEGELRAPGAFALSISQALPHADAGRQVTFYLRLKFD
jgi:hypothetical protein